MRPLNAMRTRATSRAPFPSAENSLRAQREIYQIVLGAQKAAIAAVKPGALLSRAAGSLTKIARDYINAHGKDLHGDAAGQVFYARHRASGGVGRA